MREPPPRPQPNATDRFALRAALLAFGVGLLVAVAASAGIVGERLTRGAPGAALVANGAATLAAFVALVPTMRHRLTRFVVPQIVGAVLGVAIVHALLRHESSAPWLSEKPAQLVNDAVAVAGLLAIVWACARELDARLLALALVFVTMYRVTAPLWHVDAGAFQTTVQELVVAQLVAAALVLGLLRAAMLRTE